MYIKTLATEKTNNRDANEQRRNPSVELKEKAQAEGIYLPKQRSKSTQRRKKKKDENVEEEHQKAKGGRECKNKEKDAHSLMC